MAYHRLDDTSPGGVTESAVSRIRSRQHNSPLCPRLGWSFAKTALPGTLGGTGECPAKRRSSRGMASSPYGHTPKRLSLGGTGLLDNVSAVGNPQGPPVDQAR